MMHALPSTHREPIPGYRLIEPLGRGGFGEVWKCEAPGGLVKAIKFVRGNNHELTAGGNNAQQELRALQHIKSIRHPFLISIERVELIDGDLVLVMELAERSLHDLLQEVRREGRPGLPRKELLGYLRETAEVLDLMNQEHGLQHLDVKPRNLFLVGRHVKVADFGLVNSLADLFGESGKEMLGGVTPLYAAPETFQGQVTLFSDQYSLAVTYHELLTGEPPIKGKNLRHLMLLVAAAEPDLSRLPEADRAVVGRALAKNPRERFPSCTAFIEALEAVGRPAFAPVETKPHTTSFDLTVGDMSITTVVPVREEKPSGTYRRQSRVEPAGRAAPTGDEVLPGYELQECLGLGPAGEVWSARGPLGDARRVRFLTVHEPPSGSSPLERLLCLRHENLPDVALEVVDSNRVALISEAGDSSLHARLKECQAASRPGIPRQELLGWLAQAADALDQLYHLHQLQHLALTPSHLVLSESRVLLLDFGLAELLWLPAGVQPAAMNPRYSASEMFNGLISDACDQYSLALVYQELLVGVHPFRNLNARQMASPRLRGQPDVSLLPASDRPIVLQALHPQPNKRFRSCREFILALEQVAPLGPLANRSSAAPEAIAFSTGGDWRSAVDELVAVAGRGQEICTTGTIHYRMAPGSHIEHRCTARLAAGMAQLKMDGFREQWQADLIQHTESRFVMEVRSAGSLLQRCLSRVPGLIVEVVIGSPIATTSNHAPIRITLQPSASARGQAGRLLAEMGPRLLESLQTYLHSQSERAGQKRYPLGQVVQVQTAGGQAINAEMRDIGREGLCLVCPCPMPAEWVTLRLTRGASQATVEAAGKVRDCTPVDGGRFEVEIAF